MELDNNNNQIYQLIVKSLLGTADQSERENLRHLMDKNEDVRKFYEQFSLRKDFIQKYRVYKTTEERTAFENFKHRIHHTSVRQWAWWRKISIAASIIVVLGGISFLLIKKQQEYATQKMVAVLPNTSIVYLTTANGTQIPLGQNEGKEHQIDMDGIKANDKKGTLNVHETEEVKLQTVTVPRGAEYNVTLPDGTEVHLNAESSITFPTRFGKDARKVTLTGEAYFKVRPTNENTPFYVLTNDIIVRQYGTEFNINSYPLSATFVTLIKGSIGVTQGKDIPTTQQMSPTYTMLTPGYQAVCEKNCPITIKAVNLETVVGWHEGWFRFDNAPLSWIANDLERQYDINIDVDKKIDNMRFTGSISKNEDLGHILDAICQSSNITYIADDEILRIKEKSIISQLIHR